MLYTYGSAFFSILQSIGRALPVPFLLDGGRFDAVKLLLCMVEEASGHVLISFEGVPRGFIPTC